MQAHCTEGLCNRTLTWSIPGFRLRVLHRTPPSSSSTPKVSFNLSDGDRRCHDWKQRAERYETVRAKKKDNVWSIDNDLADMKEAEEKHSLAQRRKMQKKKIARRRTGHFTVMVSAAMLMKLETVLQTQEPVIKPSWDIFASSLIGIWKGVGAAFSPFTAKMEPIAVGNKNENLFDCYTLSYSDKMPSQESVPQIQKKTKWVALNPFGEAKKFSQASCQVAGSDLITSKALSDTNNMDANLPSYESFDFSNSEVLEEDIMSLEPGLVFFEDGSYSRGPANISVGEYDESKYFLSPTYKFEQCIMKGCHKRLRIVHIIEFNEGGANIQVIRVAVYEEERVSPINLSCGDSELPFDPKPISQRRRVQPVELAGSWRVFQVSAIPIPSDSKEDITKGGDSSLLYSCIETLKKRSLPVSRACFGEEDEVDANDVTILWLPGGVAAYVDVNKEGILCIGVCWYSNEGINLVMERDYGMDGKLKEVRSKSEVKR